MAEWSYRGLKWSGEIRGKICVLNKIAQYVLTIRIHRKCFLVKYVRCISCLQKCKAKRYCIAITFSEFAIFYRMRQK